MTPADQETHALESLRLALGRGWDEADAKSFAVEALVTVGVNHQDARRVAWRVWDAHFRIWGAV